MNLFLSNRLTYLLLAILAVNVDTTAAADRDKRPPNIIVIVADDLGIGDLGHTGSPIRTPHIDQLAMDGVSFTHFYASANVCSPSRAGLLTGRYPIRMGLAHKVVDAGSGKGLPASEVTLAEELKARGYRTALVGKWHLGDEPEFWPTEHGFDTFFGVLHSNDMRPFALYEGTRVVGRPVDQNTLTRRYTERAASFIQKDPETPFFLYLGHTFPHYPLHASEQFRGRSEAGLYGDAVEELDWSLGQVVNVLRVSEQLASTLIAFTSDNGAWFEGSNQTLRDGKGHTFDGGFRVPFIMRWPGQIDPGTTVQSIASNLDLLPTLLEAPGVDHRPPLGKLDGQSLWPLLRGEESNARVLYLFNNEDVAGIRTERWKYLVRGYYRDNYAAFDRFEAGFGFAYPLLYDMKAAMAERYSVAERHPNQLAEMKKLLEAARREFEPMRTVPAAPVVP